MSSDILDNISPIKDKKQNENENNDINQFSRNFSKYYYNAKNIQEKEEQKEKKKEKINKSKDSLSKEKYNKENKENKNSKFIKTTGDKNNSDIFSSLIDFDLLNSGSQLNTKGGDNMISSNNMGIQTTTSQSAYIQNLKNKYIKTQKKSKKKKLKTKPLKNLKKNSYSQTKFESFLERVKDKQKKKEIHINNIRSKSLESETSEMHNYPEISKISLSLLKKNNRKPLYQQKPLNEEKQLEKNFQDFYNKTLKDNLTNTYIIMSPKTNKNKDNLGEKYNKFYEDKMKWKKIVEQKNKNRKLNNEQEYEEYLDNFPFKPSLNKNSINIANKLYRNRSIANTVNNNFYENGNDKETLEKFKIKIKPLINNIYNDNNYRIYLNKKNHHAFRRTVSEININKINNYNIDNNNCKIKKNHNNRNKVKINYKINEKKYLKQNVGGTNKKGEIKNIYDIKEKDYNLWNQLEGIKSQKVSDKVKQDLYKLNVRPGTSWNYDVINKITPSRKCERLIEDFL